ncbi:MAG: amidohydrolase family protein [Actinobacteria bacterium]|nr:amidohydrolase family protein [Actinomycetota bacterium]
MKTLFTNATFWSSGTPFFSSMLVENETIIAFGQKTAELEHDEVVDLNRAFVMPAFADGHAHPLFAGREMLGPQVNGLQNVSEIVAEVARFAKANPDEEWIIGGAYEAAIIEQGDFDARWLDEVVSDRPVVLHAVDHHTIWVNSKALELSGITTSTNNPDGGTIARRDDGSPKGTLREPSAIGLVTEKAPPRSMKNEVKALALACDALLNVGITSAVDAWIEPGMAEVYIEAAKTKKLTVDMSLCFLAVAGQWEENVEYYKELRKKIEALSKGSNLEAKTIKFLLDGALSSGTAALMDPYLDDPTTSGLLMWEEDDLLNALCVFDDLDFQVHLHAIGDAAVRQALDAIEAMQRVNPRRDRRPVIAHAQLIHPDDIKRFERLGVIANYQPLWTYLDPMNKELILPRLGEQRNNHQYPLRSMLDAGAMISYGSDWPVTSQVPLEALAVPVHRQSPDGYPPEGWSKHEAITIEESMTSYTCNVAFQNFKEERLGRLEAGMRADFVVLDQNPCDIPALEVRNLKILALYRKGEPVPLS